MGGMLKFFIRKIYIHLTKLHKKFTRKKNFEILQRLTNFQKKIVDNLSISLIFVLFPKKIFKRFGKIGKKKSKKLCTKFSKRCKKNRKNISGKLQNK